MQTKAEIIKENLERAKSGEYPLMWGWIEYGITIHSHTCGICYEDLTDAEIKTAKKTNRRMCNNCKGEIAISKLKMLIDKMLLERKEKYE